MRRGRVLILLGLILAIGAAAAVFILLQSATQTVETEIPRESVVVAKQPIAEGELVADRLEIKQVPSEIVLEGAVRSLDGTGDMIASGPIPQGSIVYRAMLQTPEEQMREGRLGSLVEQGYIAIAFPISEMSSVSYGIQPGDYIDVLMTFAFIDLDEETQTLGPLCPPMCPTAEGGQTTVEVTGQRQRYVSQLTVQDVLVLGVGRWNYGAPPPEEQQNQAQNEEAPAPAPPKFITLMLQPQDALVLKLAREHGASIELAVRNSEDHQVFQNVQQVTLDYLMARFGISLPPKHEYTIETLRAGSGTE
jgi:Flp pilus assembly protein CpaB